MADKLTKERADVLKKERADKLTKDSLPKPREWSHFETVVPGDYRVLLEAPDKKLSVLSEVDVQIPEGKQATISVRTSLALIDIPVEGAEEIARDG